MKLNNKGWNCQEKNNQLRKKLKIKGIAIIRIRTKFNKKKELKSND
jgi:hypothetical protein